uniref:Uncharacterized protein n=1 Tax=Aegilops tauschii subsp. strangulata TaxID=200361 RepID=A0A453FGB3_AEGTS
ADSTPAAAAADSTDAAAADPTPATSPPLVAMARRHPAATSAKRRAAPPNPSPPAPPADGSLPLLHATSRGDLRLFKRLVRDLDQGRGRPREVVEAAKDQGLVALHFATGKGRPRVCRYLVEELGVDVDTVDDGELGYRKLYVDQQFTTET